MATCDQLSQQMKDLSTKIKLYQSQIIVALNAHDQQKYDDASQGLTIASGELDALHKQYLLQGCQVLPPRPAVPIIRILIVLDGMGSFGPTGNQDQFFGLSTVIRTLTTPMKGLIFLISRAHRQTDPQDYSAFIPADQTIFRTDYTNFKFDDFDNEGGLETSFDEIWMFGIENGPPSLSQSELKAIAKFMNAGGGVFATGDHEDLGLAMCGEVMRVRNMRKWYAFSPPPGLPVAPSATDADRHDTLQSLDGGASFHFDNQSDDTPQPLKLKLYSGLPHPLLSGPSGPITKFPDHMHEGEAIVPSATHDSPTYDQTSFVEYPTRTLVFKGNVFHYQPLPEIVATGTVIGGHVTLSDESVHGLNDNVATSGTYDFGVVGAYDGHLVNVGRVAIDSTWHHFFDINLVGDPSAAAVGRTAETKGFQTVNGRPILDGMRAYYRNIVMWLAPSKLKLPMLSSIMYHLRFRQPLNEMLSPRDHSPAEILRIGETARGALSSVIGESLAIDLVYAWLGAGAGAGAGEHALKVADVPFHADARDLPVGHARLAAAALGGAAIALGRAFARPSAAERAELDHVVASGLRRGVAALASQLECQAQALGDLAKGLVSVAARDGKRD